MSLHVSKFFGESSCTVRATCMLISGASFCSLLLCAFQHSVSRLFRLKENASCHVLCIRFQFHLRVAVGRWSLTWASVFIFYSVQVSYIRRRCFGLDCMPADPRHSGDGIWHWRSIWMEMCLAIASSLFHRLCLNWSIWNKRTEQFLLKHYIIYEFILNK